MQHEPGNHIAIWDSPVVFPTLDLWHSFHLKPDISGFSKLMFEFPIEDSHCTVNFFKYIQARLGLKMHCRVMKWGNPIYELPHIIVHYIHLYYETMIADVTLFDDSPQPIFDWREGF